MIKTCYIMATAYGSEIVIRGADMEQPQVRLLFTLCEIAASKGIKERIFRYVGATTNLDQRCKEHLTGKACRTTKIDPPLALVYTEKFDTFSEARKRESQIKHWSRAKKEALIVADIEKLQNLSRSRK